MFSNILETIGPIALKAIAGAACLVIFVPLIAAFLGPVL